MYIVVSAATALLPCGKTTTVVYVPASGMTKVRVSHCPAVVVTASFSVVAGPPVPPSNLSRKFVPTAGEYTRIVTVLSVAVSTTEPPRPVMVVPK